MSTILWHKKRKHHYQQESLTGWFLQGHESEEVLEQQLKEVLSIVDINCTVR
jgi:hypothetical protein